jgi:hypothetical protein
MKFAQGIMIWLGVCYNGITRPVIIEKGYINHMNYIDQILPTALKDGKKTSWRKFYISTGCCTSSYRSSYSTMV